MQPIPYRESAPSIIIFHTFVVNELDLDNSNFWLRKMACNYLPQPFLFS
jgi:hypothetical protein